MAAISGENSVYKMETWEKATNTVALSAFGCIILIGNGLICAVFWKIKQLRQRTPNKLIFNQACTEITKAILFIPSQIVSIHQSGAFTFTYIGMYCLFLTVFSLTSLVVDRVIAILRPFRYRHIFSKKVLLWEITLIWALPLFIVSIPVIFKYKSRYGTKQRGVEFTLALLLLIFLWFIGVLVANAMVFKKAKYNTIRRIGAMQTNMSEHHRVRTEMASSKKELRLTVLFGMIMSSFVVGYLPALVLRMFLFTVDSEKVWHRSINILLYVRLFSSILNPMMCFAMKRDFKDGLMNLRRDASWSSSQ